jgi:ABC-type polysaccharide/polyol phosphate export permease
VWPLGYAREGWRILALANPLTAIIEGYRHALLGAPLADATIGAVGVIATLATAAISCLVFSRVRPLLADSL